MTTKTTNRIVCKCGHKGALLSEENDRPGSALHERYRFEGFGGETLIVTSYRQIPNGPLAAMKPACPKCGTIGQAEYI